MNTSIEGNVGSRGAGANGEGNFFCVVCLIEKIVGEFTVCLVKSLTEVVLISEKELEEGVFVDTRADTNATAVSVRGCGSCFPWAQNVVGIGGDRTAGIPAKRGLGIIATNGDTFGHLVGG